MVNLQIEHSMLHKYAKKYETKLIICMTKTPIKSVLYLTTIKQLIKHTEIDAEAQKVIFYPQTLMNSVDHAKTR